MRAARDIGQHSGRLRCRQLPLPAGGMSAMLAMLRISYSSWCASCSHLGTPAASQLAVSCLDPCYRTNPCPSAVAAQAARSPGAGLSSPFSRPSGKSLKLVCILSAADGRASGLAPTQPLCADWYPRFIPFPPCAGPTASLAAARTPTISSFPFATRCFTATSRLSAAAAAAATT